MKIEGYGMDALDQAIESDGPSPIEELELWWGELAQADINRVVPKAIEYSAVDLAIMGDAMKRLIGWENATKAEGIELALAFYELGKVARAIGALAEHRLPAIDTWDDIRIYATMAARVREVGGWPN